VSPERSLIRPPLTRRSRRERLAPASVACLVVLVAAALRCRERADVTRELGAAGTPAVTATASAQRALGSAVAPLAPQPARASTAADAGAPPVVRVSELAPAAPPDACPPTMVFISGGEFWMGSPRGRGGRAEHPKFLTRVEDYCLDTYEVTSSSYQACVQSGACSEPRGAQSRCNYGRREDHPINCVDWGQADTYCKAQGSRLPTELEWEYAARGGEHYLSHSWGDEAPAERACWKRNMSCPVGSFGAGAFGLHDMSGNVWEWTRDWFGDYPWPEPSGTSKVFRGGGFNGRVESWLVATLRNRSAPDRWGSYLGFRCARLAKDAVCPFGLSSEPGVCRHGVLDAECSDSERFNGQRCATPGAPPCEPSSAPVDGHGCVPR
jgi:formylglycine-generating enzyme required for sulfatase activity